MQPIARRTSFALLASAALAAPTLAQVDGPGDQDPRVVHAPRSAQPDPDFEEPLFHTSEVVTEFGGAVIEGWDEVLLRESLWDPSTQENRKQRGDRQGTWEVPGRRRNAFPHSGEHYVTNKYGDTRMGIGFNQVVDLHGAWFAGQGPLGSPWATGLKVVGYRAGEAVGETLWFRDVDDTPSWFAMDLRGVDRIEIVADPAHGGIGQYGLDDLTFTERTTGARVVIDFEDLAYEDGLTGSGYLGLTWEAGTGPIPDVATVVPPPQTQGAPLGGGAGGGGITPGGNGGGTYTGNGTLPVLIQKFAGPKLGDPGANAIPPDTCGSVGIDHFVSVVNSNISVYEKATGNRVFNSSLASFFGIGGNGDPRVVFDPDSQRFIVITTNFNNRIWIAVSSTPDPTGTWFKAWWNPSQGADAGKWPDYPTLGVDQRWVMSSSYMVGGSNQMTMFAIEKAPMVAAVQTLGTIHAFRGLSWEGAIQPCVHWEDPGKAYAVSWNNSSRLRIRTINPPVNAPTMGSSFVNLSQNWGSPGPAPQLGTTAVLDTLDGRLINSVYRVGSIWTTHGINTGGRASSRFYELDPVSNQQVQLGTVRDNVNNELWLFNPSIAVNSQGHAVLGGTITSVNQYAGAFYTGRLSTDPPGEMAFPFEYRVGAAPYNQAGNPERWGDYSLTSADPVDDTVWTIQERALNNNQWGNHIAQLGFTDCANNITRYCTPAALGTQIDVDTCSLGVGSINMTLSNGTPGQAGYLLVGSGNGVITNPPGASGDLCLGGATIGRYTPDLGIIDAGGQLVTDIINGNTGGGVGNLPSAIGGAIQVGDTWNFQYWSRHQGVPSTFSDALTVTFAN